MRGMIHRDLKPSNVLRKGRSFKLADFGLVTDELVKGYATRQGYTEHLAPETFDIGVTSTATDVWAMGMTTFRVLNGEPWYDECLSDLGVDRNDPIAAAPRLEELVTSGTFPQKLRWMPHVPRAWRRFVNKALCLSTTSRYRTGGAMLSGMHGMRVPHGPSWECTYDAALIRWKRARGDRDEVVEWHRHSPRKHEYVAFTEPNTASGSRRTLEKSTGMLSRNAVMRALQDFFATRSE
jgi:serine/threonine-protein kinase